MINSYYCITLPDKNTLTRLTDFKALGKTKGLPRELLHTRASIDGTKIIVQGDITNELATHIGGKAYIEYLGDCLPDGRAEQKVHDWLAKEFMEWQKDGL